MQHLRQRRAHALALPCRQNHDVHCAPEVLMRIDSKSRCGSTRRLLLFAAALLLAACSTGVRVGYTYADTLLSYSIDSYVSLTPEQDQFVRERTTALLAW